MGKKKKRTLPSLKARMDRKETSSLIGYLAGPFLISELTGRPPKIPTGFPNPLEMQSLPVQRLRLLKQQLQQFLQETGGPDLSEVEKQMLAEFVRLNPTLTIRASKPLTSA